MLKPKNVIDREDKGEIVEAEGGGTMTKVYCTAIVLAAGSGKMRFHRRSYPPPPSVAFLRGSDGFSAFSGIAHERPNRDAPGMRPAAQYWLTLRSDTPQR